MHKSLGLGGSANGNCTERYKDIVNCIVFSWWLFGNPGGEASVAGVPFDVKMFLERKGKTVKRTYWLGKRIEMLGSFNSCVVQQFSQTIGLSH